MDFVMSSQHRFKDHLFEINLIVLVCVLGAVVMTRYTNDSTNLAHAQATFAAPMTPIPAPPEYPEIDIQMPQGVPAITPSRADALPSFTEAEVRDFVMTHPPGKGASSSQYTIVTVDCALTSSDLSRILRDINTGLPDALRVCYIELEGSFTFIGPLSQPQGERRVVIYPRGFEVFDAKTGNLLLDGGFVEK